MSTQEWWTEDWWKEVIKPWVAAYEAVKAAAEAWVREKEPSFRALQELMAKLGRKVEQCQRIKDINCALSKRGWFVSPSWSDELIDTLHRMLEQREEAEALITTIICYYEEDAQRPRAILEKAYKYRVFEVRRKLLEEAFEAFLQGKYGLAIPVFLAQSEGALKECLLERGNFFTKNIAQELQELSKELPISEIMLSEAMSRFSSVLREQFAASIWTTQDLVEFEKRCGYKPLSRHAVLHGVDTSFGTKENALRALFILDMICEIVRLAECEGEQAA